MKGDAYGIRIGPERTGVLPLPGRTAAAANIFEGVTVNCDLELPRTFAGMPRGSPVIGTHIQMPSAGCGQRNVSNCISNRFPHPVGEKIRRAYGLRKLLVYYPSSRVGETLRLNKDRILSTP